MAKRKYQFDEAKTQRYLREGRGQGSGKDYKPWLTIHDLPSRGRSHRVLGMTTGRIHHLLSDGEYYFLLQSDWQDSVIDIREQFPLDREITYQIANDLQIRHPLTIDRTPMVMTSDFLLVLNLGGVRHLEAFTFKYTEELSKPRVQEKFAIEEHYWKYQGVVWDTADETDFDRNVINNISSIRSFYNLRGLVPDRGVSFYKIAESLIDSLSMNREHTLGAYCTRISHAIPCSVETVLVIAKHLLARKILCSEIDSNVPFMKRNISAFYLDHGKWRKYALV